jgi:hypothetical protein
MVATVRALVRNSVRGGRSRVARSVLWTALCRDRDRNRGIGMTGRQARLRTVKQQSQEQGHSIRDLAESIHKTSLIQRLGYPALS